MRCWFLVSFALLTTVSWADTTSHDTGITYQHGYAFLQPTKYGAHATHFDYVNPDAPKGGTIRTADMGTWDNLNPIAIGGRLPIGVHFWVREWRYLWDSLMRDSLDEPAGYYGLIAEGVHFDQENGAWVAFLLRKSARWHDGQPITADDVAFTFDVAKNRSNPTVSTPLAAFSHVEIIGPREVKFHIHPHSWGNPVLPIRAGNMPILPRHYWRTRDISRTTIEPPLGSGPYRVGRTSTGRWLEWERIPDYWAEDLPVNRGHWNFDVLRVEYFRDNRVQTEAVKAHLVDVHVESVPRAWQYAYDGPALESGHLKRRSYSLTKPGGLWWPMFFNLDLPRFQDIRVREALWLLSNYEWGAKRSDYYFKKGRSFFEGSELAARGLPGPLELELLEPLRGRIPERVFTTEYDAPEGFEDRYNRANLLRAAELLQEAGWEVKDHVLTHTQTGEPFKVRMLAVSASLGRAFVPFTQLARRLGIEATISAPEVSNWQYRIRTGDFDIGAIWFLPEIPPTSLLRSQFHSAGADLDYSYNWANIRDPAVDHLIEKVATARSWAGFIAACRALDRVLLWNFYFIPTSSYDEFRVMYWDKFGQPDFDGQLSRNGGIMTWWWDEAQAAKVLAFTGDD